MIHELKTWPPYFDDVVALRKTFEVRPDDRGFAVGDRLILKEWDPSGGAYTRRLVAREVTYKLAGGQFGVEDGFCVLGIEEIPPCPGWTPKEDDDG